MLIGLEALQCLEALLPSLLHLFLVSYNELGSLSHF